MARDTYAKEIKSQSTPAELHAAMAFLRAGLAETIKEALCELHDPKHCAPFDVEDLDYGVSLSPARIAGSLSWHDSALRVRLEIFREAAEALQLATGEAMADLEQISAIHGLNDLPKSA